MRHKSNNVVTTSAWHPVILKSDLAGIDRDYIDRKFPFKEKRTPQKIWDPHKKRRGSSSDKAKTTILLNFFFHWSTHLKSQKTQRVERLPTCTAALTRSPMTLRDIYDCTWSGKIACTSIAANTKQIPGRYCKDELTTSRYYFGVTSFVHFLHDQTQSRTEQQMNTDEYKTI